MQIPPPPNTEDERNHLREHFLEPETRSGHFVSAETKKLWKCMLDMLEEIDRVCRKHGLRYFLMSGTLIGAARHKGFIPWDDDLDICLPRPDWEKLQKILPSELRPPLFMQNAATDLGYSPTFFKVRNSATAAITPWWVEHHLVANLGIFIDVHSLDGIPSSKFLQRAFTGFVHAMLGASAARTGAADADRNWLRRTFRTILAKTVGPKTMLWFLSRMAALAPYGKTAQCGLTATYFGYLPHRGIWPTEWFAESMDADFEYLRVKIPTKTDEILTRSYGDWKTPVKGGFSWHEWMKFDTERNYKTVLIEEFGYKPEEFEPGAKRIPLPVSTPSVKQYINSKDHH